jgi:ABC-2 type transport system permease protein
VTTFLPLLLVCVVIALTFGVRWSGEWWHLALFVPSIVLAAALSFMIGWVVATATFWLQRINTVNTLLQRTSFIFAGQIAPLSLMPTALQVISYALPFAYVLAIPAEILRGGVTLERGLVYLVGQAVWLGLSVVTFQFAWRAGLREYSAVGA